MHLIPRNMNRKLGVLALLLAFLLLLALLLPFLIVNIIVRFIVRGLAKIIRSDLTSILGGQEALFALENSSKASMNIILVVLIKGHMTLELLREHMKERILHCKHPRSGKLLYSRLRYTWGGFLGYAFWKKDLNFDLNNHVRLYDYGGKLQLGNPCQLTELHSVLGGLHDAPWDRSRSPWEMLHVPNVVSEDGVLCTAMLFRVDHTLADGFSLLELYKRLTNREIQVPKAVSAVRKSSCWEKLAWIIKGPWDIMESAADMLNSGHLKWTSFIKSEPAILSVSPSISVELIKDVKNFFGVSYAAVLFSAVFGALARAAKETGQVVPQSLTGGVILPLKNRPEKGLIVHATLAPATFPVEAADSLERLQRTNSMLLALRKSSTSLVLPYFAELASTLPMSVKRLVLNSFLAVVDSFGISSFPVSTGQEFWDGHEGVSSFGCCGTFATARMQFSMNGINNKQIFQIGVNRSVLTDAAVAHKLGQYVADEINDLARRMESKQMWQSHP